GHSSLTHAFEFAALTGVQTFVPFHHDPAHTDVALDKLFNDAIELAQPGLTVIPGMEGATFEPG
ncbi:MAG TPA: hypothetical protein VFO91_08515, partial [Anaerolineales bacterium]|nr:hypothetical protein [Anaerolineales bacterium]